MSKLNVSNQPPVDPRRETPKSDAPLCRPCPRCFVPLVLERQHRSRGLSGVETVHETYACPACDARFKVSPSGGRWKEID